MADKFTVLPYVQDYLYREIVSKLEFKQTDNHICDPNEESLCGNCMKEVNGRFIFCSVECEEKFNAISEGKEGENSQRI